jgi:hypothetical protein
MDRRVCFLGHGEISKLAALPHVFMVYRLIKDMEA